MSQVVYTNFIDGALTSGISSADASATSAVFATLPEISGSDYAWLVIDPDASAGAPEVVKVTAHTASSTTVTIDRAQQGSNAREHLAAVRVTNPVTKADLDSFVTGAEYLVDESIATAKIADSAITTAKVADDAVTQAKVAAGAVGPAELSSSVFTYSPGDVKQSIRSTPETGWLSMAGQSISGADSLYPDLWSVSPAAWKSGSTLTLPDMNGKVIQGGGSLGGTSGTNSTSLAAGNIPEHRHSTQGHSHVMSHGHGDNFTIATDTHDHSINHNHPSQTVSTTAQGGHYHTLDTRQDSLASGSTGPPMISAGSTINSSRNTSSVGNHTHSVTVDVPNLTGSSGDDTHNHGINGSVTNFNGSTEGAGEGFTDYQGSGLAFSIEQSALRLNFFIKT